MNINFSLTIAIFGTCVGIVFLGRQFLSKELLTKTIGLVSMLVLFSSCDSLAGLLPSLTDPKEAVKQIRLPDGFKIEIFVSDIEGARSMNLSPGGVLYVGSRDAGNVYAVKTQDGKKEAIKIATGLNSPNGVAYKDGDLYVAEIHRVLRFSDIDNSLQNPEYEVISEAYPSDGHHGWKFIRFGPDGLLYVPVGMPCNVCNPEDPIFGTITRLAPNGDGEPEIFAHGVRNTVGFDWHPETQELWFTDNGRDWMGDNRPPDELNYAPEKGMHFGFPYCHGNDIQEPEFDSRDCSEFTPPELELGPHVAALGMRFYTGNMFPKKYRGSIFIAEHGSWNRTVPIGYRVMFVKMENNEPVSYEVFAEGWLQDPSAWGRPVDVLQMPDGALLVSDDKGDAIYRISYEKK